VTAAAAVVGGQPGCAPPRPLPALRQDLRLLDGPPDVTGAARWLIHDPLQHRFFAVGRAAHVLLRLWGEGRTADALVEEAWVRFSEPVTAAEVEHLSGFLLANGLTVEAPGGGWRGFHTADDRRRRRLGSRLLHGYLFFRVPLVRPEPFLDATLDLVRPLGTRTCAGLIALAGLLGLYLVSREWEAFATTLAGVFTWQGAVLTALALPLVKLAHELGHAYVARHHGCRVPVIGVAFVLGFPLLYADVTDVWRLTSRRARIAVASAGVLVDLAVACLATLAWAFLPPGAAKSLAFSLATVGWILGLTMNLNPFMRFDGYHVVADAVGIDNLQTRAGAVARWRMRETVLGLGLPAPEALPRRTMDLMALYGAATWVYRVILFTAIAIAVYGYFFKVLGLVLFLVEIVYFVVAPLCREIGAWITMRHAIVRSRRAAISAVVVLLALGLLIVPWSARVEVPAVIEAGGLAAVHPPVAARVRAVHVRPGVTVAAGDLLVSLEAPALDHDLEVTTRKLDLVALRRSRRASDTTDKADTIVLDQEHAALSEHAGGLHARQRELEVRAPIAGRVVETATALHVGRWVGVAEPLAVVTADGPPVVRGYLEAAALWRVEAGATARFVPDDVGLPSLAARVRSIAQASVPALDQIELVAAHGGRVATRPDAARRPVPVEAQYTLRAAIEGIPTAAHTARTVPGLLVVDGRPESLLAGIWRRTLQVLVRESGF
jgi:putative peptide zinc metalloprotease protein